MSRTKSLNIVVRYGNTGYVINDLGFEKSPRFELYYIPEKQVVKKTNHPLEFDDYMKKIFKKLGYEAIE